MSEDASLDDFLGSAEREESDGEPSDSGAGVEGESDGPSEGTPPDETATAAATETVEPATTTYAWSSEGAACAACGEVVERRWQQAGDLVCVACKDWDAA